MHARLGRLNKAKNHVRGNRAAFFVIEPGPERKPQFVGEQWPAVLSVKFEPQLTDSLGKVLFEHPQVGFVLSKLLILEIPPDRC